MGARLRWLGVVLATGCGVFAQVVSEQWITRTPNQFLADPILALPLFAVGGLVLTLVADRAGR
ncbi:MAG: hypothetical protein HYY04_01745 [Chloroflexi bacterium]|nr:hypothetical protein [Chloroflexota bacterium]